MSDPIVHLSDIDTERYGIRIARANGINQENLPAIMEYCRSQSIKMLIARSSTTDLGVAQSMEKLGFLLMDTLVYYSFRYDRVAIPEDTNPVASIRTLRPGDEVQVEQVARAAFKSYFGHYHADPRLDRRLSDAAYPSWAVRSCTDRNIADEVLVAESGGKIVAFATIRMNSAEEGEGVLIGVTPAAQRQGIHRSLMVRRLQWVQQQGAKQMIISTQVTNIAAQKVWARLGFTMSHSYYTFHKWFDD